MSSDDRSAQLLNGGANKEAAPKRKSVFLSVCSFIIVAEFCERLAYYGLTGSITIFFKQVLKLDSVLSTELSSAFTSWNYITPLIGAYIADTYWGRFKTIWVFCVLYIAGMIMCTVASLPDYASSPIFFCGLMLGVAVGSGGIKPNVVVLGADQFDPDDPEDEAEKDSYFNYFYWAINIGAVVSFGFLAYVAVNGVGSIPARWGFFVSFLIPTCAMCCALLTFLCGSPRYQVKAPEGSALATFGKIVIAGAKTSRQGALLVLGVALQIPGIVITVVSYFQQGIAAQVCAVLGGAFIVVGVILFVTCGTTTTWLDALRLEQTYSEVEIDDVADVLRLSPYVGYLIMFWCVYNQMSGSFILQGCQMDLRLGSFTLSPAQLNLFDCTVILAFIPIFDSYLYPALERNGITPTPLRKIGSGFVFCALSMIVAAYIEVKRRDAPHTAGESPCDPNEVLPMSAISVFWQVPQYLLIGTGEILTAITTYDLFYSQVPSSMRSVCQGLNLVTVTLGSMVSSSVLSILKEWYTNDLNNGHLEYIYLVFAGMMLLNLFFYVLSARGFQYKDVPSCVQKGSLETTSPHSSMHSRSFLQHDPMYAASFASGSFRAGLSGDDVEGFDTGDTPKSSHHTPAPSAKQSFNRASFLKASFHGS